MSQAIPIYCGYDAREAAGYHVFCQSVLERASVPVSFIPLHKPMIENFDGQKDGTNAFIYSRFLVPYLQNYNGWAIFADAADMVVLDDIAKLWALREENSFNKALAVVKHDYRTKHKRKYIGTPMESDNADYPGKNRSSVILWNCGHYANRRLTPDLVKESPGSFLHRFQWVTDEQVGELPPEWNALSMEQDISAASLVHFTLGSPGFSYYKDCDGARHFHKAYRNATHMIGER
jgi:lipopolysaccharide biosynthesis glycosyltransferase